MVEPIAPGSDDGLHVLRHSTAHVLAQAVCDLYPGAKYAIGPAIDDGFYYDFDLPEPLHAGRPREDRPPDAADREAEPAVRPRGGLARRGAASGCADQPFKVEIIDGLEADEADEPARRPRATPSALYRNGDWADLCLGPHVPHTGRLGALQAHERRGRLLARRRDAPACSRGSTAPRGRPRTTSTPTCSGSRRPSDATTARSASSSTCSRSPRRSARGSPVFHPRGGLDPPADGGLLAPAPRGGRLRVRELAAHHEVGPVRDERAPRLVRRRHVPADGARRRQPVLPQADELPDPHPDLPEPHPELPRAAAAALRVRHGVPVREVGCGPRAHAGARASRWTTPTSSRRRSRWARSCARCSCSCSTCCATTGSTTSTSSCRPSPRARPSAPTRSGPRRPRSLRAGRGVDGPRRS